MDTPLDESVSRRVRARILKDFKDAGNTRMVEYLENLQKDPRYDEVALLGMFMYPNVLFTEDLNKYKDLHSE